ncbi:hypothetical protein JOB18_031703 [Solea senegalensis]|uniref:Uncharacterized protein n=1 Tax=Solea senegalensis TaxID=28829 RepID=A0AAV6QNA1_SOLSE|nr:hypothetical protein JOB18_031703 [Solea senegalensis]
MCRLIVVVCRCTSGDLRVFPYSFHGGKLLLNPNFAVLRLAIFDLKLRRTLWETKQREHYDTMVSTVSLTPPPCAASHGAIHLSDLTVSA